MWGVANRRPLRYRCCLACQAHAELRKIPARYAAAFAAFCATPATDATASLTNHTLSLLQRGPWCAARSPPRRRRSWPAARVAKIAPRREGTLERGRSSPGVSRPLGVLIIARRCLPRAVCGVRRLRRGAVADHRRPTAGHSRWWWCRSASAWASPPDGSGGTALATPVPARVG